MMGATHAIVGMVAGMMIATYAHAAPAQVLFLGGVSALAALLPDIDHPNASLRQRMGVAGHVAFFWLPHRGITHTLIALAMVSAVTLYFLPPQVAFAFISGYASHLLADSLTRSGVPLVWPLLNYRYGFRMMSTGGLFEQIINLICIGIIGWMVVSML
jgi:inner membrane protein